MLNSSNLHERQENIQQAQGDSPHRNGTGVHVVPFRGWRFTEDHRVSSKPSNFTPWAQHGTPSQLADTFTAWQQTGAVVQDRDSSFYVYEQTGPQGVQRGVLAAVHVQSDLCPHEQVIPEKVNAIAELMEGASMNLDPVLLGFSGDGSTTDCIRYSLARDPAMEILSADGQLHRLWPITDGHWIETITEELRTRPAHIADGHHRHAAALQLQRSKEGRAWDFFPALLVDIETSPMQLSPIHRVLPSADPRQALDAARTRFIVQSLSGGVDDWIASLNQQATIGPAFVLVTSHGAYIATDPHPDYLKHVQRDSPASLHNMHLAVLHDALIDDLWKIPDHPETINYEHTAQSAVQRVLENSGVAVLTTPPTREELESAALAGVCLPRKSTSFGPKPHPGLTFRTIEGN